ncbi:hypothetical protein J6590_008122 [Homalodisca vitripennis]|nr:hypothetical protein J6590_008122 [Homalodisca vitripennis]
MDTIHLTASGGEINFFSAASKASYANRSKAPSMLIKMLTRGSFSLKVSSTASIKLWRALVIDFPSTDVQKLRTLSQMAEQNWNLGVEIDEDERIQAVVDY